MKPGDVDNSVSLSVDTSRFERPHKAKKYIIRSEPFGYTIYDRSTLSYRFVKPESLLAIFKEIETNYEMWLTDLTEAPMHILYAPLRVYFEVTNKCNLRCRTCFNSSGEPHSRELTTEEILSALKGMRLNNIIDLRFTGGEITQRPDWYEILLYAKELGFVVSLNTNGIYDDIKVIDQLVSLKLDQISVSIDGTRQTHDSIRGEGTFDKTVGTLEKLYTRAPLRINTLILKGAEAGVDDLLRLANKYASEINFFYMRPVGRGMQLLDQAMSVEELFRFGCLVKTLQTKYPSLRILHSSQVMRNASINTEQKRTFNIRMGGPDGFTRLNLLADGSIWPGGYAPYINPSLNLGNIMAEKYSLLQIWRNSETLNRFRERSYEIQMRCLKCPEKNNFCAGASVEMEVYRDTTEHKVNPYCLY